MKSLRKWMVIVIALLLGMTGCGKNPVADMKQKLQKELDRIAAAPEIPGVTFAAMFADGEIINLASGVSDKEKNIPMKPDDIMFSGSIGKNFAAALALKLVSQGKFNLDDLAILYFEDQEWFKQVPNGTDITIRMLLNHSTGITRYAFKKQLWEDLKADPDRTFTGRDRLAYVLGDEPLHQAGEGWSYSDTNYIIIGMIMEMVTGQEYNDMLKRQIIKPHGLSHTEPATRRDMKGLIPGYSELGDPFNFSGKITVNGKYAFNPQLEWTGGGVTSNVIDLVKWIKVLYSGDFLNQEELALMTAPLKPKTDIPKGTYGFATIIWNKKGRTIYGHTGFVPGYRSIVQYIPEYKLALAMQINSDRLPRGFEWDDALDQPLSIILTYKENRN